MNCLRSPAMASSTRFYSVFQTCRRSGCEDIVDELSSVSVDVAVIPAEAIQLAPDYRVQLLGQLPVLTLWQRPFRDVSGIVKRGEDLLIAGAALVLSLRSFC